MPVPTDTDRHGLVTLAQRWTPRGMRREPAGRRFMDAIAEQLADLFNPMLDFAEYAPILLNPHRCSDEELERILSLQGISARRGSLSFDKLRRLAILGADMRSWRGAFRSHRTVATAITGGPVILRSWIVQRAILDESTMDIVLLGDDDDDTTQLFVIGQGDGAVDYNEAELGSRLDELAKPVLDELDLIDCFAVTAWRNGINGWAPDPVASRLELVQSDVDGEYEGLDLGPDVNTVVGPQFVRCPFAMTNPGVSADHTLWMTVWFHTSDAVDGEFWEAWAFGNTLGPYTGSGEGYVARVYIGNHKVEFYRVVGMVYTLFGTFPFSIPDGTDGDANRLDILCSRTSTSAARMRVYVNNDPSPWFDDPDPVVGRPDGDRVFAGLDTNDFTDGRLRIAAVTARIQD